jgi:2,4-dienoyl-CoA reductase-like NADH-dependent reductase (Old Yellow Enzyme family)
MAHEVFHYRSLDEVRQKSKELGAFLPLSEDVSCLFEPLQACGITFGNRLFFQPMEGTDGTENGAPGEFTCRRYMRFAASGASLIWFEAVATMPRVRASAHQLWLTNYNADMFKRLLDDMREESLRKNGFAPVIIMQATNSGRYSKPTGKPDPVIAYSCPPLEAEPIDQAHIASDSDL